MKVWKCSVCRERVLDDVVKLMSSIKKDDPNDKCMCMECFMQHGHFISMMFDKVQQELKEQISPSPERAKDDEEPSLDEEFLPLDIKKPEGFKVFQALEIEEAIEFAQWGGQAIHLHRFGVHDKSPKCFRDAIARGEDICHLFDQDKERLVKTARSVGVRVIYIDKEDTDDQHIDLCGKPLQNLLEKVKEQEGLFD